MGRPRNRPAEFFSDWHYENHLENLAREIEGRKTVLAQYEATPEDTPDRQLNIDRTKMELDAAKAELNHYTGPKNASKRPKAQKAETR